MGAKGSVGQGKSKCKSSMGAQRAGCPPHPHKPKQAQSGVGGGEHSGGAGYFSKKRQGSLTGSKNVP